MIDNKAKVKIASQYLWQEVLGIDGKKLMLYNLKLILEGENITLHLKDPRKITKDEAFGIANAMGWGEKADIHRILNKPTDLLGFEKVCSYLRSVGYAVPSFNHSVGEMVKCGFVKLILL